MTFPNQCDLPTTNLGTKRNLFSGAEGSGESEAVGED